MNNNFGKLLLTATIFGSLLLAFAATAYADAGDDQFAVAANHYQNGRWKLATDEFETLLVDHSAHRRVQDSLFFLGESLMQLGSYEQAATRFDQLVSEYPNHRFRRQAMFRRGEAAHFADNDERARKQLTQFVDQYGLDPLAAYAGPYLASRELAAGEYQRALATYDDSARRFPTGPLAEEVRFGRAETLHKLGRTDDAVAAFRQIAADPKNRFAVEAGFQLGLIYYTAGNYSAAEKSLLAVQAAFQKTDRPNETLATAIDYWLGLTYKGQEKWPAAAQLLLASAERATTPEKQLAARYHAGDALFRAKKNDQAEAQFSQIMTPAAETEWADDIALARMHLAIERGDTVAVKRFATLFDQKLSGSLLKPEATRQAANYLLHNGEANEAAQRLQELATAREDDTNTGPQGNMLRRQTTIRDNFTLAIALQRAGQLDQAVATFAKVVQADNGTLRLDALLAQATIHVSRKQYAKAIEPLEAYAAIVPVENRDRAAMEQLVLCYAQTKQFDTARSEYEKLTSQPNVTIRPETTLSLAEAALSAGERQWSAELFRSVGAGRTFATEEPIVESAAGTIEPSQPAVAQQAATGNVTDQQEQKSLAGLAWSQFLEESHEQSAATFEQLLTKYPKSPLAAEAAFTRGQALEKTNKTEAALEMYLLVIDKFANSPHYETALLRAASAYDALQHNDEALQLFDRLQTEFPASKYGDDALYQSAWVARELKRDDAQARFEQLHQKHRDSKYWPDATYRIAVQALAAEQHETARRLVDDLLAASPPSEILEHTLYLRGQVAAATGDWAAIDAPLNQLLAQFPTSRLRLASEYWLAEAHYQLQQFDEATARFDDLARKIQGVEGNWPAMVPLRQAQLLARAKQWQAALKIAETIATQFPSFAQLYEVSYLTGRCHFADAKFDEARERFEQTIKLAEGRKLETAAMAQWMIGESYFHQKNYDSAIREYYRVEALYGWPRWQAAALLQAGKCHEHRGEWSAAVKLYDRVVNEYAQTDYKAEAARRRVVASQRAETSTQ